MNLLLRRVDYDSRYGARLRVEREVDPTGDRAIGTVIPSGILVAAKQSFEFVAVGIVDSRDAFHAAFQQLPLEAEGWERAKARIAHRRNEPRGMVWRLERGR